MKSDIVMWIGRMSGRLVSWGACTCWGSWTPGGINQDMEYSSEREKTGKDGLRSLWLMANFNVKSSVVY